MQIAVLSDTHLREGRILTRQVWNQLQSADLILHAGDLVCAELLNDLRAIAPVGAVRGNCDGWDLAELPYQNIVVCEDIRIGLTHGFSGSGRTTPERAFSTFLGEKVDCIIFGHSHAPYHQWQQGILLFNPGSPTDKRREEKYSFGWLDVQGAQISARHVFFDR